MATTFFEDLQARGLIHGASEGARELFASGDRIVGYIGFDPTADSLHVGSLLQIIALMRLQRAGHRPIALVGGGTGMIGDPSGKTSERQLLTREREVQNVAGVRAQLERIMVASGTAGVLLVDNDDLIGEVRLIVFLRGPGQPFTVK